MFRLAPDTAVHNRNPGPSTALLACAVLPFRRTPALPLVAPLTVPMFLAQDQANVGSGLMWAGGPWGSVTSVTVPPDVADTDHAAYVARQITGPG